MGSDRMKRCACTIASLNYLSYADVLCDSFLEYHPDCQFFVLIVDRVTHDELLPAGRFIPIFLEDLKIPDLESIAFKYDIVEFNTNVKPSFLKYLLRRGMTEIIYLDPDIFIYGSLEPIYECFQSSAIILTPHSISPAPPSEADTERAFLALGVFNLGFVGIKASQSAEAFLAWWEARCISLGYKEPRSGLFVDQKWVGLAPAIFEGVLIWKHPGCNVAYWNLFERAITRVGEQWLVNECYPLLFFHFSGFSLARTDIVSTKAAPSGQKIGNRSGLDALFNVYREAVRAKLQDSPSAPAYSYGTFSNGIPVSNLARRIFGALTDQGAKYPNPFDANGMFYKLAARNRLIGGIDTSNRYDSRNYPRESIRIQILHWVFRVLLRVVGSDRYSMLLKYLGYFSVLRNQVVILKGVAASQHDESRV